MAEAYELLALCQRDARSSFPPLWEAWSLYHRLRQLAVPLAQLEETSYAAWGTLQLRKRLERLRQEWPSDVYLEARWPRLTEVLQDAYDFLLKSEEPPKFWGVAERVAEALRSPGLPCLRIVVPTKREGAILSLLLSLLEEGWSEAQQQGWVEVVTAREEARLAAAGDFAPTLLLGYRAGAQRYLDLYPPQVIEVIAYPHEAGIDKALQERIYSFAERFQENQVREAVLRDLRIQAKSTEQGRCSPRPRIRLAGVTSYKIRKAKLLLLDPSPLDLERLAGTGLPTAWDEELMEVAQEKRNETHERGRSVEVTFADGRKANYTLWQSVYIYYPAVEQVRRCTASELYPGMHMVVLVDALYESLYERLLEAIRARVSPHTLIVLELWNRAKGVLLQKHCGNRRDLHRALERRGFQVGYHALRAYFGGEDLDDQALAPLRYADMKVMSEYSGLYPNEETIRMTFAAIQQERQRRREAGRALHALLRAIVTGEGYDSALEGAQLLGHEVAEVLAAVEVRTVQDVRITDRNTGLL
ncbi:MAG: hypothetical protein ACOYU7_03165 [Bacillota bacterium]